MDMAVHSYCQFCKHLLTWGGCYNDCCVDGNRFEAIVTPEKFAEEMIHIKNKYEGDTEMVHFAMDKAMYDLLKQLGYEHGVKVFKDIHKGWKE